MGSSGGSRRDCARARGAGSSSSDDEVDSGVGGLRDFCLFITGGGGAALGFGLFFAPAGLPLRFGAGGGGEGSSVSSRASCASASSCSGGSSV